MSLLAPKWILSKEEYKFKYDVQANLFDIGLAFMFGNKAKTLSQSNDMELDALPCLSFHWPLF